MSQRRGQAPSFDMQLMLYVGAGPGNVREYVWVEEHSPAGSDSNHRYKRREKHAQAPSHQLTVVRAASLGACRGRSR